MVEHLHQGHTHISDMFPLFFFYGLPEVIDKYSLCVAAMGEDDCNKAAG